MVERLAATGIVLLGTLRPDGWARISPCEAYVVDGDLMLGMMWRSKKALDLLRDSRLTVVTPQAEREPVHGDLKLYGSVVDVPEPERRRRYADTLEAAIKWRPPEPYHLFAFEVERAGFISFGEGHRMVRWSPGSGLEDRPHPDDAGAV